MSYFNIIRHLVDNTLSKPNCEPPSHDFSSDNLSLAINFGTTDSSNEDSRQAFENLMRVEANISTEEVKRVWEAAGFKQRRELLEVIMGGVIVPMTTPDDDPNEQQSPAVAAYIMRLVLEERDREIVLGDLVEKYERTKAKQGKRRADLWLYYEVVRSVWPLVRRLVVRIGGHIVRTKRTG